MVRVPNVLVMNAETAQRLKINTVADLVRYAKANPAKLNYGSGGNGSAGHLAGELFKKQAGIFALHIPYNGGNPAQLALLSGQVDFNFDNLATAAPNIRSGKLKAIAVTTLQRSSAMPDVPPVADLVRYAKANPAKLNYGSGGNGSAGHLAGELFKKQAGIFALHIPYNGGNPAQLALLSGQVDFNFDNLATAAPNIRSGKLKAIAVTTLQRSSAMPELPPVADTLKGFSIDTWWGLVAPAGTPHDVVMKLNQAFVAALNAPETKTRFATLLAEPVPSSPEQFGAFMKSELSKYEAVVKATGARVD